MNTHYSENIDPEKVRQHYANSFNRATESECRKLLKRSTLDICALSTNCERQREYISELETRVSDMKNTLDTLRAKNKKLQQQVDSYSTYSDDSRAKISVIQYRQMLGEERNEKYYYIKKLKKEIGKTTELVQAVKNLKQRNKSLLGNFKVLNSMAPDDLELSMGLFTELIRNISAIMDRRKPDTTLDFRETLGEVIKAINQQANMINEIYTVIQADKVREARNR